MYEKSNSLSKFFNSVSQIIDSRDDVAAIMQLSSDPILSTAHRRLNKGYKIFPDH